MAQVLSFVVDYGMDLDTAFHTPRIDASEGATLIGDARLDAATQAALAQEFDYRPARLQTMPMKFACPSAVMRSADAGDARGALASPASAAMNSGATEIFHPWADAAAG